MYDDDPRYPPHFIYDTSFSELNDPRFWTGIADRTGIIPMQYVVHPHVQIEEERFTGPQALPALPSPGTPPAQPVYTLSPYQARRYPVPYQPPYQPQQWVHPTPTRPAVRQAKTGSSSILYVVLFCVLLAILGPAVLAKPATPPQRILVRLSQLDASQYNSPQDAKTWGPSACSPAAMTEVLNYYSTKPYRIADILAVEDDLGEITPQLGMLNGDTSIRRTVAHFGMKTTVLSSPTLEQIVTLANKGTPVIVNFPPQTWNGGHFLLVRGGNAATTVDLVDSSLLDKKIMSREQFLSYWRGFAVVVEPA